MRKKGLLWPLISQSASIRRTLSTRAKFRTSRCVAVTKCPQLGWGPITTRFIYLWGGCAGSLWGDSHRLSSDRLRLGISGWAPDWGGVGGCYGRGDPAGPAFYHLQAGYDSHGAGWSVAGASQNAAGPAAWLLGWLLHAISQLLRSMAESIKTIGAWKVVNNALNCWISSFLELSMAGVMMIPFGRWRLSMANAFASLWLPKRVLKSTIKQSCWSSTWLIPSMVWPK